MIETVNDIEPATLARADAIIDVRSPAEFAEDHVPGAINLPVLDNEERAEVGAIYVQQSRFLARRIGAAYVARNVARHLETALADKGATFRPLLYCWRGGMRSNAMATILSQIGWRVGVLAGGYKTWRRAVVAALFDSGAPLNLMLVDGQTGAAKTEILNRLKAIGAQAIDLEGLAAHRGSVFGADIDRAQPRQKFFESQLFDALRRLEPGTPAVLEAESSRIGSLVIPKRVWAAMRAAPRIEIRAAAEHRADYLVRAYGDVIGAPGAVAGAIERLRRFHAKETIEEWLALAANGDSRALALRLMREHYDPLYDRARKRDARAPAFIVNANRLHTDDIDRTAAGIAEFLKGRSTPSPP